MGSALRGLTLPSAMNQLELVCSPSNTGNTVMGLAVVYLSGCVGEGRRCIILCVCVCVCEGSMCVCLSVSHVPERERDRQRERVQCLQCVI